LGKFQENSYFQDFLGISLKYFGDFLNMFFIYPSPRYARDTCNFLEIFLKFIPKGKVDFKPVWVGLLESDK